VTIAIAQDRGDGAGRGGEGEAPSVARSRAAPSARRGVARASGRSRRVARSASASRPAASRAEGPVGRSSKAGKARAKRPRYPSARARRGLARATRRAVDARPRRGCSARDRARGSGRVGSGSIARGAGAYLVRDGYARRAPRARRPVTPAAQAEAYRGLSTPSARRARPRARRDQNPTWHARSTRRARRPAKRRVNRPRRDDSRLLAFHWSRRTLAVPRDRASRRGANVESLTRRNAPTRAPCRSGFGRSQISIKTDSRSASRPPLDAPSARPSHPTHRSNLRSKMASASMTMASAPAARTTRSAPLARRLAARFTRLPSGSIRVFSLYRARRDIAIAEGFPVPVPGASPPNDAPNARRAVGIRRTTRAGSAAPRRAASNRVATRREAPTRGASSGRIE
jgi:hypothetical protein